MQGGRALPANKQISFENIHRFLRTMFAGDLHAKRILSLAGATLGAIESASLAVALIGQGLALARGLVTKHAIKQVDRMLANQGIDVDVLLHHWVPFVVGKRPSITVAMDWTEFEADGQATIMLSLLCRHGRATPLVWLTDDTATLKDRRNGYEYQGPGAPGRGVARRCARLHRRRSWLRRSQAVSGADRRAEVRLRHPLPRQHHGDRRR